MRRRNLKKLNWSLSIVLFVSLVLLVPALAACGGGDDDETPVPTATATVTITATGTPAVTVVPTSTPAITATPILTPTATPTPVVVATAIEGVEMPPYRAQGTAKINGVDAPSGTVVYAFIDGALVGEGTVASNGSYRVQFAADAYLGKTIVFKIGSATANEAGTCVYGLVKINLTATQ